VNVGPSTNTTPAIMHSAAVRVIENFKATGEPFALFLSSWQYDEARRRLHELTGKPREVAERIEVERYVRALLKTNSDIETVAILKRGDEERIAMPNEWPALSLTEDEWQTRIAEVAELADLIVLFVAVTNEGVAFELDMCSQGSNALKTVVISSATPREMAPSVFPDLFPRIVSRDEIPPGAPHAEFDPLLERIQAIKAIEPGARAALADWSKRLQQFPLPAPLGRFGAGRWVPSGSHPAVKVQALTDAWRQAWEDHQAHNVPFVLHLKDPSWSHHDEGIQTQALIDFEINSWRPKGVNVVSPLPFDLTSEDWRNVRRQLIARADIVVLECFEATEDKLFELKACMEFHKYFETVLILPSPESERPLLDHEQPVQLFPRALWSHSTESLMVRHEVGELSERIARIGSLAPERRKAYFAGGTELIPVTCHALPSWYLIEAKRYSDFGDDLYGRDLQKVGEPINRQAWWCAFWCTFRAANFGDIFARMTSGQGSRTLLSQSAAGFYCAARLLGIYHEAAHGRVITGDLNYAYWAATMAKQRAAELGDWKDLERDAHALALALTVRREDLAKRGDVVEPLFTLPIGDLPRVIDS
jgi:hypothetical protein